MYLPHAIWVAIKFLHLFMVWWNAWGLRNTEWNFGYFMLQLGTPVVLYLQASALVTSSPDEVRDWRNHFYSVRRRFFGLNIAFALINVPSIAVTAGIAVPPVVFLVVTAAVVALSIAGFRSESHRVQLGIASFAVALNLVAVTRIFNWQAQNSDTSRRVRDFA